MQYSPFDPAEAPCVLVVDDDEDDRRAMARSLREAGFLVEEARSAFDAVRTVLRRIPDAAVVDVLLPDEDGTHVTRAIHAIASSTRVPVLLVTRDPRGPDLYDAERIGAECLLVKPIASAELVARVRRCLARRDTGGEPPAHPFVA